LSTSNFDSPDKNKKSCRFPEGFGNLTSEQSQLFEDRHEKDNPIDGSCQGSSKEVKQKKGRPIRLQTIKTGGTTLK